MGSFSRKSFKNKIVMKKFFEKVRVWWYFHMANPVVREGQSPDGAFRWKFRRFTLELSTESGNWKAVFTAAENPYAYLLAGGTDDNIIGFCRIVYMVSMLVTTDQGLANDIGKAINKYQKRLEKAADVTEDEVEEKAALDAEKEVQEFVEMTAKERRKDERDINKRFRKAVKEAEKK